MIHPALRMLSFLLWVILLSRLDTPWLVAAGLLIFSLILLLPGVGPVPLLQLLRRARWLFVAVALVYLAFTPGVPVLPLLELPSRQGLAAAAHRILALLCIIASVSLLLQLTPRPRLYTGLDGLVRPLARWVPGLDRLAPRLALVLEIIPRLELALPRPGGVRTPRIDRLVLAVSRNYSAALTAAARQHPLQISAKAPVTPRFVDYLLPAGLLLACIFA